MGSNSVEDVVRVSQEAHHHILQMVAADPSLADDDRGHYWDDEQVLIRKLCTLYASGVCRLYVERMQAAFPREIRDMIYEYIIWSCTGNESMHIRDKLSDSVHADIREVEEEECEQEDPWFIRVTFIGPVVQREILEILYRNHFTSYDTGGRGISVFPRLEVVDAYNTGLTPIQFVKGLWVHWGTHCEGEPLRDPQYWPPPTSPTWSSCFDSLLRVKDRSQFHMQISIWEPKLSFKHLGHLMETFRPVYEELTAAGACIQIWYGTYYEDGLGYESADLQGYYSMEFEQWRAELLEQIEEWEAGGIAHRGSERFRQNWDIEGDASFDRYWEEGRIHY